MSKKLLLVGVILAGCGLLAGPVLLGLVAVLFGASAQAAANPCVAPPASSTAGLAVNPAGVASAPAAVASLVSSLPGQVGRYRGDQVANAAVIIKAGQAMGLDAKAVTIGVMTAMGESQLVNIDRGDGVGPDARGLFQQRANGAWGSYEERMNPALAAARFFTALTAVPGYLALEPTIAAHKVQRNADPYHYASYWADAVLMVSTLTGDPSLQSVGLARLGSTTAATCVAAAVPSSGVFADAIGSTGLPGPTPTPSSRPSRGRASKPPMARVAGTGAAWRS